MLLDSTLNATARLTAAPVMYGAFGQSLRHLEGIQSFILFPNRGFDILIMQTGNHSHSFVE